MDFDLPMSINNRYKNKMGCIKYKDRKAKVPEKIILAGHIFDTKYYDELNVDDTILHELCHWYCSSTGKNSSDKSRDFEAELKRIGASTSGISFSGGLFYVGKCEKCGKKVAEKHSKFVLDRILNTNDYITRCCHAYIVDGGTVENICEHKISDKVRELNRKFKEYLNTID